MKYRVEFHKEGVEEAFLTLEAEAPFPQVDVDERLAILHKQTGGQDEWRVRARTFIFWEQGCTVEYWCSPEARMEAPPQRKAITEISDPRVAASKVGTVKLRSKRR